MHACVRCKVSKIFSSEYPQIYTKRGPYSTASQTHDPNKIITKIVPDLYPQIHAFIFT